LLAKLMFSSNPVVTKDLVLGVSPLLAKVAGDSLKLVISEAKSLAGFQKPRLFTSIGGG